MADSSVSHPEIWKVLSEFDGKYLISSHGRVFSALSGKILKTSFNSWGYERLVLKRQGKPINVRVHRLVAEAFILNPSNLPEVNHKDGIKTNNCVGNLEWCSKSENHKHAYLKGLWVPPWVGKPKPLGKDHHGSKAVEQINPVTNEVVATFDSIELAAQSVSGRASNISNCCHGKRKTAAGYKWRFTDPDNKEA